MMNTKAVNEARSLYYGFFSKMLVYTENNDKYEDLSKALEIMIANPMEKNSQEALKEIQLFMTSGVYDAVRSEYDEIFHSPESAIVRSTASFYDEGVESGKKRVEVKNFLGKTKIRRDEKQCKEPEDSIGFLMTFMHELVELTIAGEESYQHIQHCLFSEVLNEFWDIFIPNLYENEKSNIYKSLAIVMSAFLEFERLYFKVSKPKPRELTVRKDDSCEFISDVEAKRRAENRIKRNADALIKSCSLEDTGAEDTAGA